MTRKRTTAQEVADAAGVSKWTVIRTFKDGAYVGKTTREKIISTAKKLNYSPNLLARSLATSLTNQVAIFVDDFGNPHKLPFLERLTDTLQSEGMVAVLININSRFDHIDALMNVEQRRFDAAILFGTAFRNEALTDKRLTAGLPPTIVLARDSKIKGIPAVNCNTSLAMKAICEYLGTKAYRRPAFMSGPTTISTALGRNGHFVKFWQKRGLPTLELKAHRYSAEAGAEALRQLMLGPSSGSELPFDLIMCENDILACGVKDYAVHSLKLRVPDDIAIVGFDNIELTAAPAYDITSYEQPRDEMVRAVVDMILRKRPMKSVNFTGRLVLRSSA